MFSRRRGYRRRRRPGPGRRFHSERIRRRGRRNVTRWLAAAILAVAVVAAAGQQAGPWLTGQFLVAADEMGDPRFEHTVIYMVRHDDTGAMGLIVNRPIAD